MICPKCGSELNERLHEEVAIDVCIGCRGIWLDSGELAKIVERSRPGGDDDDGDGDGDGTNQRHRTDRGQRRERGWLERLGDLFG